MDRVSDLRLGCQFLTESKIIKYTKIINHFLGKEMPAVLGFMLQAILGIMINGIPEFNAFGALSIRISDGSLVLMAACSVRSNCVLYLV